MLRVRLGLLLIGAAMMAASVVVLVRNRGIDDELLASIALVGSICVMIIALILTGNDKHR
jgi:hypothetical protein